jgi:hypothetical protein
MGHRARINEIKNPCTWVKNGGHKPLKSSIHVAVPDHTVDKGAYVHALNYATYRETG